MGIGLFALPYFVKQIGLLGSLSLISVCMLLNYFATLFIFQASKLVKRDTYLEVARILLGDKYFKILRVSIFLEYFNILILYCVVCWKLFQFMAYYSGFFISEWLVDKEILSFDEFNPFVFKTRIIFFMIIYLVSSYNLAKKKISSTRYISLLFVLSVMGLISLIVLESFSFRDYYISHDKYSVEYYVKNPKLEWIICFFTILFAFNNQIIILDLKKELFYPTYRRLRRLTRYTLLICFLGTTLIACLGYYSLGDHFTPSLIFLRKAYDKKSYWEKSLKILLAFFFISSILGLPTINVPLRRFLFQIMNIENPSRKTFLLVSYLPFMIIMLIATVFPFITKILGISSVSFVGFDGYITPYLLKWKILKKQGHYVKSKILLLFMIVFTFLALAGLAYSIATF